MPETVCAPRLEDWPNDAENPSTTATNSPPTSTTAPSRSPNAKSSKPVGDLSRETTDGNPAVIKDALPSLIETVEIGPGPPGHPFLSHKPTHPQHPGRKLLRHWGRRFAWVHIRWR